MKSCSYFETMPVIAVNKQPYDTRFIEMRLLSSFNAVCSVLLMNHHRSQTALRTAARRYASLPCDSFNLKAYDHATQL